MLASIVRATQRKLLSWRISWAEDHAALLKLEIKAAPRQLKAIQYDLQRMRVQHALLLPPPKPHKGPPP